jgi:hypothetical protein
MGDGVLPDYGKIDSLIARFLNFVKYPLGVFNSRIFLTSISAAF